MSIIREPVEIRYKEELDALQESDKAKIIIQVGQYSQKLPYSNEGIELAKGFLDLLGKQLIDKKNSKNN